MHIRRFLTALGFAMAALPATGWAQPAALPALPNAPLAAPIMNVESRQTSGQMTIPANKSQLLHIDQTFGEISVGSKEIADVVPLSRNLIYVLGKKRGATNLTIQGTNGAILAVIDVAVTYDIDGLKHDLTDLVPGENISIRPSADSIVLTGKVSSPDKLRQILSISERYAPEAVTNLLTLGGSQQVLLQVRFAEVQRNALKNLGANFIGRLTPAEGSVELNTGQGIPANTFGAVLAMFGDSRYAINSAIDALERRGALRTLAEPNLVALSGDTASFLAGGQIPIPVVQSISGTASGVPVTTIQYKDFGVGLSFTPTVIAKETVNLEVNSEVSALDPSVAIETSGISVPGLKVRRAKTTIEVKDGQSFSIAGLLQDDFQDGVTGFPFLSRLPILGALFRSSSYQHQQTELVVLITVHLVDPSVVANLASPAGALVLPTEGALFGKGNTEGATPASAEPSNGAGYVLP